MKPPLFHIADSTPSWMKAASPAAASSSDPLDGPDTSGDSDLGIDSLSEADEWGEDSSLSSHARSNSERFPSEEPETRPTSTERQPDDDEWAEVAEQSEMVRSETARPETFHSARKKTPRSPRRRRRSEPRSRHVSAATLRARDEV